VSFFFGFLCFFETGGFAPGFEEPPFGPPPAVVRDFDGDQLIVWPEQADRPAPKSGADAP
jgi:hypothetical protein